MSHSREERLTNLFKALLIMLKELDGAAIYTREFDVEEPIFQDIFRTTWRDLEKMYCVEPHHTLHAHRYYLTGEGWRIAVNAIWEDNEAVLDQMLGDLMKALKAEVKGRDEDAYVDYEPFAISHGLSVGFVYNAIDGNLIEQRLEKRGAHWYEGDPIKGIEIPLDFGLPLL